MPNEKSEEDSELPKATIDNLIHDVTPKDYVMSKEVRASLRASARLFLNNIATDANKLCEQENKKTIGTSHTFKAMQKHGFGMFVDECEIAAKNYDEYSKYKPSKQNKLKESGKTMEELQELQMKLFKQAAEEHRREFEIAEDADSNDEN